MIKEVLGPVLIGQLIFPGTVSPGLSKEQQTHRFYVSHFLSFQSISYIAPYKILAVTSLFPDIFNLVS